MSRDGSILYKNIKKLERVERRYVQCVERKLKEDRVIDEGEYVSGVFEELCLGDTMSELRFLLESDLCGEDRVVNVYSKDFYDEVKEFSDKHEVRVETKYKTVAKKVKPVALPLPLDCEEKVDKASMQPHLRDPRKIGHEFIDKILLDGLKVGCEGFLTKIEEECFREMLLRHGKAFAFEPREIGCVDPSVVAPMVIFTISHTPWNLRPIPVPKAHLPKLVELLNEKINMEILEPSIAPYSNRWFTVPKKNGTLRFIQDMQPVNKVTIRNMGSSPIVDEFAEAFAGRAIYSMGDLYSGYDQFQLAMESRDLTTMRTPLGLVRMCTLPQGATNSVAHMMNGMNKVLRDFIPEKTMPFLDDVPIKGCAEEDKEETLDLKGCRRFVADHIADCEKILTRLEEVHLTLSGAKSMFGVEEIMVVGHMCGAYGRKPSMEKVDAIQRMKECANTTEVRRFLGACIFYHIWIPHFAHVADPLYSLLRKGQRFQWEKEQSKSMKKLKKLLSSPPTLKKVDYDSGRPVVLTVDASPIGIGWAIGQDDGEGNRFVVRFGAKVLNSRQRAYAQVKRELWGVVTAMKHEKEYLIGASVVVETDCLPLLGMITSCSTPDLAMLRWIAYIKSMNPEFKHIAGKDNAVADMLSRARYEDEVDMVDEDEDVGTNFYTMSMRRTERLCTSFTLELFTEELYEGEWLNIGRYLSSLEKRENWSDREFKRIRRKAYGYFLRDGFLWKHPKLTGGVPQRVVCKFETQQQIVKEFHESWWAGHRGVWATFAKVKERYWWKGMYKDVADFVASCGTCQVYSSIRHRDGLHPTYPLTIHYKWVVDLVAMPMGVGQKKYLVLAREDLSNQVEGRALRTKTTEGVCRFLLEDVICRYGCVGKITADRGELDAKEAREFFGKLGVKLALTTAYNPEANGKSERGHSPIVKALVKACDGRMFEWPRLLPYALWADRTTHSTVTGYMPAELMFGQKPVMPIEEVVPTWNVLPWEDDLSREDLLALRIRQLERKPEDIEVAIKRLKEAREKNKERFDRKHRLRPKAIQEGDWVLVYDSSLDNQHSTSKKFAKRWFGPYVVKIVHDNATYSLRELDGTELKLPVAGKRIKLFRRRGNHYENEGEDPDFEYEDQGDITEA